MTKHTPNGAVANIRLATGDYVVIVQANGAEVDTELDVLALLTSAPDMLDALKELADAYADVMRGFDGEDFDETDYGYLIDARAAILKATGKE